MPIERKAGIPEGTAMPRIVALLAACLFMGAAVTSRDAGASPKPPGTPQLPMTIKVLSVKPQTATKRSQVITVKVRYTGIVMDPLGVGGPLVPGHGHMQLYLGHIPSLAYQTTAPKAVVKVATTPTFYFVFSPYWWKAAHGRHTFLIALAKNNNVLYRVKPASFTLTVK
jgi:hypothetical protein